MSHVKSTPACKDGANLDDNLPHGRRAKSNLGRRDDATDPKDRLIFICAFSSAFIMCVVCVMVLVYAEAGGAKANVAHRPDLFIRLVGKGGLDPLASPPTSPLFQLAFDFDGVSPGYRACSGGGNSLLRVSYHGMILAWGQMPYFCINGGPSTDVATLEAKAEASMLREEVRNLMWSEIQVVGRIEFDVEGEVAGLGYLHCKLFLLEDKAAGRAQELVPRSSVGLIPDYTRARASFINSLCSYTWIQDG